MFRRLRRLRRFQQPEAFIPRRLASHSQREGQHFTAFIEDSFLALPWVNSDMSEDDKISHLMKEVAEDIFQLLVAKDPLVVAAFSAACKVLEEAHRFRLDRRAINRLPNVASFSPSTAIDSLDIHTLIREVLREELRVLLPECCHNFPGAVPAEASLQTTIREEVRWELSGLTDLVPMESPPIHLTALTRHRYLISRRRARR